MPRRPDQFLYEGRHLGQLYQVERAERGWRYRYERGPGDIRRQGWVSGFSSLERARAAVRLVISQLQKVKA